jgi:PAS domain S-box-containing protein
MEELSIEYLQRRDTVLAVLLDTIFDGVYIVDTTRTIIFWNRGAEEITGFSADEVAGRRCADNILNHIDPDGTLLCSASCPLAKTLETGAPLRVKVYTRHKSGRRLPVMTHIAPIRNKEGNIIAAIEVFRDISKEEEFRLLQEKFSAVISKYVSSTTFDEVMSQVRSGVERVPQVRDLTVLFLDVVGFTSFTERHCPEEAVNMLNDLFGICEVITRECHGDIDKFIGDSVMAVFVDANDAVSAAEKILYSALPKMNAMRTIEDKEAISVRIGINSGNLIQGDIGTIERKDLTVIGDVVNTASRIERESDPNTMFISEATFSRLKNPEKFIFDKKVQVKGKRQPVPIFRYAAPAEEA